MGEVRYWLSGDCDMVALDATQRRVRVAVVGCEPTHPLLGVVWLKRWQWQGLSDG